MTKEVKKEKKKISKKTILIASILVVLIGAPLAAYLITQNAGIQQASWYNSSWAYRKSITVGNSTGSTLTNEDVLINIDSAALVTAGKLQSDCDDLRFVDSDDSTLLTYWIEGGCNTTSTNIWVRIPSLPNGGKTIYMYYDNSSATAGEQSWSGNFFAMSTASCSGSWTRVGAYDGLFVRGNTSYGGTGGASTHSHTVTVPTVNGTASVAIDCCSGWGPSVSSASHSHSASGSTPANTTHTPPYLDMIYCRAAKLDLTSNDVVWADSTSLSGWTRFSALDSKFPRGASSYGGTGGLATHSHTISLATDGGGGSSNLIGTTCSSNCRSAVTGNHSHSVNSDSTSGSNIPPYLNTVYFQKNASGSLGTERPIVIFNTTTMPLGWERFTALDTKFPQGASTYGTSGGNTNHSHSGSIGSASVSTSVSSMWWNMNFSASTGHSHTVSWSTNTVDNLPPYIDVIFAKRKASQSVSVGTEEGDNVAPTAPTALLTQGATNPQLIATVTPYFSAIYNDPDTSDTSANYQIQVNTASDFTGTSMWDSTKTSMTSTNQGSRSPNITYNGSTLSRGQVYYWRIKFWDALNNESPWSSVANFKINQIATAPTSLLAQGATDPQLIGTLTPTLSAIYNDPDTSDTSANYQIQVNTASNFTGTSMWDSTKTAMTSTNQGSRSPNITYNGTTLTRGQVYYWRIKFWDAGNEEGAWSEAANFKISQTPTAPTGLLTQGQTNPTKLGTLTPNFVAQFNDPDSTDTSSYYQLQVNTASNFAGTSMWDSTKTAMTTTTQGALCPTISYNGTALSVAQTYYWRIKFWDSADLESPWSSTANFTTADEYLIIDGIRMGGIRIN